MSGSRVCQQQIDDANADIVGVVSRYVDLKRTGKSWSACCPFHNEKSPSFTVSPDKEMYYCFGCGASGDAVAFVVEHTGCTFREAVESINGRIELSSDQAISRVKTVKAVTCSLPGHFENREKAASVIESCQPSPTHLYFLANNTAPHGYCMTHRSNLMIEIINNIGETVNVAAINGTDIRYAAGGPSYGSTAVINPVGEHDGRTIICQDYSHAWRIWWACSGKSRVLACLDAGNLSWMISNCRERFTHVGCDPLEREWYADEKGLEVFEFPVDPYFRVA